MQNRDAAFASQQEQPRFTSMTLVPGFMRSPKLVFAALLGVSSLAGCFESPSKTADETAIVPFPAQAGPAETSTALSLDTPIERIAADPAGKAVLDKDIPGLLTNPNYPMIKGMNLKTVAALSSGKLDDQTLAETKADLAALPKQASLK